MWRLILSILFFLLALLVLFKAPTNLLWKTAVAVTSYPYVFIVISIALLVITWYAPKYKAQLLVLNAASLLLYLSPVISAFIRGNELKKDLQTLFEIKTKDTENENPFSLLKLFAGREKRAFQKIKYSSSGELYLDFYSHKKKAPCLIIVHGGSWSSGNSAQLPELNSLFSAELCHVAAINYHLAPASKSPVQVNDTEEAINYLIQHSEELQIDSNAIFLLGRSAGGQIALCAAYGPSLNRIRGVISLYAPADMIWGGYQKGNQLVLNTDKVFDDYLGGSIREVPEKYKEASACDKVTRSSPPTLIIHGKNDAMVAFEHSVRISKKLEQNFVPYYFLDIPQATHGFDYNLNSPAAQLSTYAIKHFIRSLTPENE